MSMHTYTESTTELVAVCIFVGKAGTVVWVRPERCLNTIREMAAMLSEGVSLSAFPWDSDDGWRWLSWQHDSPRACVTDETNEEVKAG